MHGTHIHAQRRRKAHKIGWKGTEPCIVLTEQAGEGEEAGISRREVKQTFTIYKRPCCSFAVFAALMQFKQSFEKNHKNNKLLSDESVWSAAIKADLFAVLVSPTFS